MRCFCRETNMPHHHSGICVEVTGGRTVQTNEDVALGLPGLVRMGSSAPLILLGLYK